MLLLFSCLWELRGSEGCEEVRSNERSEIVSAHCFHCAFPSCAFQPHNRDVYTQKDSFLFLLKRSDACFVIVFPRNRAVDFCSGSHFLPYSPSQPPLQFLLLVVSGVSHKIRDFMNVPPFPSSFRKVHSGAGEMSQSVKHLLYKNEELSLFFRNYVNVK